MDNQIPLNSSMRMDNEEHYRQQAATYRDSSQYKRMVRRYPVLQNSIKDCIDEKFFT